MKFDDLLAAYEWVSSSPDDSEAFVSRVTGIVHCSSSTLELDEELPDDIEDGSIYVTVPKMRADPALSLALLGRRALRDKAARRR